MRGTVLPLLALWLYPWVSARAAEQCSVLVLGVNESRSQDNLLQRQLELGLRGRGAQVFDSRLLTDEEQRCGEKSCLLQIARTHHVQYILQASLHGKRNRVDVILFDVRTLEVRKRFDEVPAAARADSLLEMCVSLLNLGQAASPTTTVPVGDPAPQRPWAAQRLPSWRLGVGGGLAMLGIGLLATAVATTVLDHRPGDCLAAGQSPHCYYDFRPLYVPSYIVAGGSLIGSFLTFVLPGQERPNERKGK